MDLDTNLQYVKRSTKHPQPGDLFVMLPPDGKYLFQNLLASFSKYFPRPSAAHAVTVDGGAV